MAKVLKQFGLIQLRLRPGRERMDRAHGTSSSMIIGTDGTGLSLLASVSHFCNGSERVSLPTSRLTIEKYVGKGVQVGQSPAGGSGLNVQDLVRVCSRVEEDAGRLQEGSLKAKPVQDTRPR